MATEIEIKARVSSPWNIREVLHKKWGEPIRSKRRDRYFRRPEDLFDHVRLRSEGNWGGEYPSDLKEDLDGPVRIAYKDKKVNNGIEQNLEIQFSVDDGPAFEKFLEKLGFFPGYGKEKFVESFYDPQRDLTYELVFIPDLGWFVEIEKLLREDEPIHSAQTLVRTALKDLGLSESGIEPRSYKDLLKEAHDKSQYQ